MHEKNKQMVAWLGEWEGRERLEIERGDFGDQGYIVSLNSPIRSLQTDTGPPFSLPTLLALM